MATIIPTISSCSYKITAGEKRLARLLERNLSETCTCWYDIPTGQQQLHPDFIILAPKKGIIFLEVKDWFITRIKQISPSQVLYGTPEGDLILQNPIEQVRNYAYHTIDSLKKDPQLRQSNQRYSSSFLMPYGYGVYLSNITREQLNKNLSADELAKILPQEFVICKDELSEFMAPEAFSSRLFSLIKFNFSHHTTAAQLDRIRWHLYPDVRIKNMPTSSETDEMMAMNTPTIISIMDTQQELLARSMGEGHRVIHGVAGSGKTLILLHRCLELASNIESHKPVLVICYNITLARKLSAMILGHQTKTPVIVKHFHAWCREQVDAIGQLPKTSNNFIAEMELAFSRGFDNGEIAPEQYSAVLIDEGHDFKSEWLKILSKMPDANSNSLLFLYDDTQSIYQKKKALDFTLSSVDIKAQGRTTILNINYRNTQEILHFASSIAFNYLNSHIDSQLKYTPPSAGGVHGDYPRLEQFDTQHQEITRVLDWVVIQRQQGTDWSEIAILCPSTYSISAVLRPQLDARNIPYRLLISSEDKKSWVPNNDCISVMPLPSSKGLEFQSVVIMDAAKILHQDDDLSEDIKRLYVGFTRARYNLLVTMHGKGALGEHLAATYQRLS